MAAASGPQWPFPRHASLWLSDIGEPSINELRLVVVEAKRGYAAVPTEIGAAYPVRPDATSRAFELTWRDYIAYNVINESYIRAGGGGVQGEGHLSIRENSAFLTYVASTTFATDHYPGKLTHWSLDTEWHCIDVVSVGAPELRELTQEEVAVEIGKYVP